MLEFLHLVQLLDTVPRVSFEQDLGFISSLVPNLSLLFGRRVPQHPWLQQGAICPYAEGLLLLGTGLLELSEVTAMV